MSQNRKIADCINVRINLGNYQHIELVKYAEETIEYSNDEERIEKENKLTSELFNSLIRTMQSIPKSLNKDAASIQVVEESIKNKIPEWLANGPVPNIANVANNAAKKETQIAAEQKAIKDTPPSKILEVEDTSKKPDITKVLTEKDLFEDEEEKEAVKTEEKQEKQEKQDKQDKQEIDDDDLFK